MKNIKLLPLILLFIFVAFPQAWAMDDEDIPLTSSLVKQRDKGDEDGDQIHFPTSPDYKTFQSFDDLNSNLIPFTIWVKGEILEEKEESTLKQIVGFGGLGLGALAAYSSAPLAGDFAVLLISSKKGIFNDIAYVIGGVNSAIPSMALNAVATKKQLQGFIDHPNEELIVHKNKRKALYIAAHTLGIFSAASSGYVGYLVSKDFPLALTITLTSTAYVGCYMFTVESQKRISNIVMNYIGQGEESRLKRQKLQDICIQSMKSIAIMPDSDFNATYSNFFKSLGEYAENEEHQNIINKVRSLLKLREYSEELLSPSQCNKYGRWGVLTLGAFIGTAETYIAYALVKELALLLCDVSGIENVATRSFLSITPAILACIPWGALDIEGVCGRFVRIYDYFFNKDRNYQKEFVNPKVQTAITAFSIWGGVSAAIPPTYLAIKTTENLPLGFRIILTGATFLCPATVLTEALDILLNQGWSWIKSYQLDSLALHKEKLIQAIESIYFKIEELPEEIINSLDHYIFREDT